MPPFLSSSSSLRPFLASTPPHISSTPASSRLLVAWPPLQAPQPPASTQRWYFLWLALGYVPKLQPANNPSRNLLPSRSTLSFHVRSDIGIRGNQVSLREIIGDDDFFESFVSPFEEKISQQGIFQNFKGLPFEADLTLWTSNSSI